MVLWQVGFVVLLASLAMVVNAAPRHEVKFKNIVLDTRFVAEGVAVADVNRDGKLDVMAGDVWYEAPDWTPHEIEPVQKFDGEHGYSNCFICFAVDLNHDGWPDQIVIGMPGDKAVWRENPKGAPGPWKEHVIWRSACNESPGYYDLLGDKKPVLVMGYDEKTLAWFEPATDPYAEWICHDVSAPDLQPPPGGQRFSHGLGVGDLTGDGRNDILCNEGFYIAPKDPRSSPWQFVRTSLGPACAQMLVYDVNRDGLPDVIASSAHEYGVWWYEQKRGANGPEFVQHEIDKTISETHAIILADMNGDGLPDLVTGKRFWAHGPTGDPGAGETPYLVWYEMQRKGHEVSWVRHIIDDGSGVGTQFEIIDINKDGLPDIVVANKKGVFVFEQVRP